VDARFDNAFQRLLEVARVDVVLIQADADVLWIDFHQLAERVLQAPADGDGAAHRGVVVGELLAADGAGGVDAGAGLIDDDVSQVGRRLGQGRRGGRDGSREGGARLRRRGRDLDDRGRRGGVGRRGTEYRAFGAWFNTR